MYMSYKSCCQGASKWFKIQIEDREAPPFPEDRLETWVTWKHNHVRVHELPDSDWVFVPDSLPSVDDLLLARGSSMYHQCDTGPLAGLHRAFSDFADRYCSSREQLPLVS